MKMKNILLTGMMACIGISLFFSCQEEGLVLNGNDVSYINFNKDLTKDTTRISFEFYPLGEGMDVKIAEVPIEVAIFGKIQDKDLEFTIAIDEKMSTFPASQCILPEKCVFKSGQLLDTIYVKLKNFPDLKTTTKFVALRINAGDEVGEGIANYSRAIIAVTDRLVKPDWWDYKDIEYYGEYYSSVDWYYLGDYSDTKFRMFLEVLQENDDELFDGKDRVKLRKYSLSLKYKVAEENARRGPDNPLRDEKGVIIEVPVAG
ncbi:DUF4843 domain-containing protein [Bacteroides faecium]|uniref:DUF4843 domain-containing protein n=1 Tax=Bacteroides faecium TaxID=2715212 RepID=A0A6H0KM53_9BACE|nr:DUF4843 domain-containing protein [Bacteroides faecium]QIU93658.1 DUF4843 domain-containing protein [Bacteroides faecium]